MALTKVKGSGVEGITNLSNATFLSVDASEVATLLTSAVINSEGGAVTTNIAQGLAKSWVYLQGTDTFGIQDSFNTASATDNGEGDYTTTRSNALANDNYATAGICSATGGGDPHYNFIVENSENSGTKIRTTTALRTYILNAQGSESTNDAPDYSMTFMGDLA